MPLVPLLVGLGLIVWGAILLLAGAWLPGALELYTGLFLFATGLSLLHNGRALWAVAAMGGLGLLAAGWSVWWNSQTGFSPTFGLLQVAGYVAVLVAGAVWWRRSHRHERAEVQGQLAEQREAADLRYHELDARDPGCVTLLHLSDLHFRSSTVVEGAGRADCLKYLEEDLARRTGQIDLVIVTGDLVEGEVSPLHVETALANAERFLRRLCRDILKLDPEERLVVIPGNHDYRYTGLVVNPAGVRQFHAVFTKYGRHALFAFPNAGLHLLLACFDSNLGRSELELATGYVDISNFALFEAAIDRLVDGTAAGARKKQQADAAFRIALVHHHPLPVADAERLRTKRELRLGRKLEGAPELMLLRNAGVFLYRLHRHGFRLVLHGHLHQRDYQQSLSRNLQGNNHSVEVVSAGSVGAPNAGEPNSFNLIRIDKEHFIQLTAVDFHDDGKFPETPPYRTGGYEAARLLRSNQRAVPGRQPVRCDVYSSCWEVRLPEGDVVMTQAIRGLRADTDQEVHSLDLFVNEPTLTQWEFRVFDEDREQELDRDPPADARDVFGAAATDNFLRYRIRFPQPLRRESRVNLLCRWRITGFLYSCREDQENWGRPADQVGWEWVGHSIRWPCERLLLTARFFCFPSDYLPVQLDLAVRAPGGQPAPNEEASPHLTMDYWSVAREHVLPTRLDEELQPPQAALSVYRPQVGFTYALRWGLLKRDAVAPVRGGVGLYDLRDLQRRLCRQGGWAGFLARVLDEVRRLTNDTEEPRAYLFGHDRDTDKTRLICVGRTGDGGPDPLSDGGVGWGRDVIGTAFRVRSPVLFVRDQDTVLPKDPTVEALIAIPLLWPDQPPELPNGGMEREPVHWCFGVIAVAARGRHGAFGRFTRAATRKNLAELMDKLNSLWREAENTERAAALAPPPTAAGTPAQA